MTHIDHSRAILHLSGADWRRFLQDLITNDLAGLGAGAVYAALLSPQGKYLFDFFLYPAPDGVWLDVDAGRAPALAQRLGMYRLRADVAIAGTGLVLLRGFGPGQGAAPDGAWPDPRHPALGWRLPLAADDPRAQGATPLPEGADDALRVRYMVPATGAELRDNDSYILEMGFERLNGVDFRKGCYVGQEVTARMKHKTELRKGLARVHLSAPVPPGTEIVAEGRAVGQVFTQAQIDGQWLGLAHLRHDRIAPQMTAGEAQVTPDT